jgi:signal transduction histidine kinase
MSAPLALAGWALATCAALLLLGARRRDAARRERIARACHELRGPLHAAGLALHGAGGSRRVAAAREELRRAALALADLDAAPLGERAVDRVVAVDLGALIARHVAAWRALAHGRGGRLEVRLPSRPAIVHGDPLRLAQATANLVANAVEHGGGDVGLRVGDAPGDRVVVEVVDGGPGLPAPVATLAQQARAGRGRRGRGLAIASDVAAGHGGRLAAAPAPHGARLVLELPRATPAVDAESEPGA